jgi:xanthine dehydrogenase molybdenum-binding subunit
VGTALGIGWGRVRIIKPYIGGGFGNRQDALYEPLNAWLAMQLGGRVVKLELSREEIFTSTRVRHPERIYIKSWVRKDDDKGKPNARLVARQWTCYAGQGGYASHGQSIAAKGTNAFRQLYQDEGGRKTDAYTVYTNALASGAMRGYGIPQATFAIECNMEDTARAMGVDPIEFRLHNLMPVGYQDPFSKDIYRQDSIPQCIKKCRDYIHWDEKRKAYAHQTGNIRKGVGMALFWYNTAVWPISLEVSSCRMVLNQDGSIQVSLGETEIGQGADTVFAQMAAATTGIPFEQVHMVTVQDTDVTPFGTGAYGSRQSYVGGHGVKKCGLLLKSKIIEASKKFLTADHADGADSGKDKFDVLDIIDGNVVDKSGKVLMSVADVAMKTLYTVGSGAEHITAEATAEVCSNAYSFGCTFAEVEVDIALAKLRVLDICNAHDAGTIINPQPAEAQVHGGMSMGMGFALGENYIYDKKTGRLLNGTFLDYKLATAMDAPPKMKVFFAEYPEPTAPFGNKALGEPPTVSIAPAIRNALLNATGVAVNTLPLSPHTLYPAFVKAGLIAC